MPNAVKLRAERARRGRLDCVHSSLPTDIAGHDSSARAGVLNRRDVVAPRDPRVVWNGDGQRVCGRREGKKTRPKERKKKKICEKGRRWRWRCCMHACRRGHASPSPSPFTSPSPPPLTSPYLALTLLARKRPLALTPASSTFPGMQGSPMQSSLVGCGARQPANQAPGERAPIEHHARRPGVHEGALAYSSTLQPFQPEPACE